MNPGQWERISALFAEARSVPPDRRAEFLDHCCGRDTDLRAEVEKLLIGDEACERDGFMGSACPGGLARLLDDDGHPIPGQSGAFSGRRIGGYRLLGLIGRGGTAEVYEAAGPDGDRVAFKLIRLHMASDEVLRRFRVEQGLLAAIDHPHIARFLGRGLTDDGVPYLVMELIEGRRIDRYCDEEGLDIAGRVRLLLQVCRAVAFLHERGVLHRDLSPPNILITREGSPRLVDFGIAKSALDPGIRITSHPTATGAILGTPEYLSPEQAMGRTADADPRTDVYILGALLYRLLAERPPFQALTLFDLFDAIRHNDPVPPTRINAGIPRPLEVIALTCLQKDPRRRYATAGDLADDLSRWLDGRPIKARPLPLRVKVWLACRRRPAVAALAMGLVLSLVAGFCGMFHLWRHAEAERARAEAARREAEGSLEIATTLISQLEEMLRSTFYPSQPLPRDRWYENAGKLLEQIAKVRTIRGFRHEQLSWLSQVDGLLVAQLNGLERWDEARRWARDQIELLRECREQAPGNLLYLWQMIDALTQAGLIEAATGQVQLAIRDLDQAVSLALGTESPSRREVYQVGYLSLCLADRIARDMQYRESPFAHDSLFRLLSHRGLASQDWPELLLIRACALADRGESGSARRLVEALAMRPTPFPADTEMSKYAAVCLGEWASREVGRWDRAAIHGESRPESWDREADEIVLILTRLGEGLGVRGKQSVSMACGFEGGIAERAANYRRAGQIDRAERTTASFLTFARRLVQALPDYPDSHWMLAKAFQQRSKNAWKRDDLSAVRRELAQCVEELERAVSLGPEDGKLREDLRDCRERLAAASRSSAGVTAAVTPIR